VKKKRRKVTNRPEKASGAENETPLPNLLAHEKDERIQKLVLKKGGLGARHLGKKKFCRPPHGNNTTAISSGIKTKG